MEQSGSDSVLAVTPSHAGPNGLPGADYAERHRNSPTAGQRRVGTGESAKADEGGRQERSIANPGDARRRYSRTLERAGAEVRMTGMFRRVFPAYNESPLPQ